MSAILKLPVAAAFIASFMLVCDAPMANAEPTDGKEIFHKCVNCHGAQGQGKERFWAPGIAGLPADYVIRQLNNFKADIRGADYADVTGHRMRPMARMLKTPAMVKAVSDYVAKLRPAKPVQTIFDGNPEVGQKIYAKVCKTCHGDNAGGMPGLGTDLRYTGDWYLLTQLKNFKSKRRGANLADGQGASMVGKVWPKGVDGPSVLSNEQAMKDVRPSI